MHITQIFTLLVINALLLLADRYIFAALQSLAPKLKLLRWKFFKTLYWGFAWLLMLGLWPCILLKMQGGVGVKGAYYMVFFITIASKLLFMLFCGFDDLRRWLIKRKGKEAQAPEAEATANPANADAIPRSEFLLKTGLLAGSIPLASLGYGIVWGAYDYQVLNHKLYLPNLPKQFDGMRIAQISDLHLGSFDFKKPVLRGVELLMKQKADVIFFTGDLVNASTPEVKDYLDVFTQVKAPLGVYSIFGNHDYGDYFEWQSPADRLKDHNDLIAVHKHFGWDLLQNEHRRLKVNGAEIGILGSENWGTLSRFPKYGRMDKVVQHTDDLPVKLLLSHDPSHWRAEITPQYPQIDAMFSGHTHGM